jgi:hypothetical protein
MSVAAASDGRMIGQWLCDSGGECYGDLIDCR